jgi:hypothetical protein
MQPYSFAQHARYRSFSRFTDPRDFAFMLDNLPDDVVGMCTIARQQTIHHNLLTYYGVPNNIWGAMSRVWPPNMPEILRTLQDTRPHTLYDDRQPTQRIIGACMLESHFLASMLRYHAIPVRIRAGYFRNIRTNGPHIVMFWEHILREKGDMGDLLAKDPQQWLEEVHAYTLKQNVIDHHIEHWICEYWDERQERWRLLDANNVFLKAHSDIDVDFHLPKAYFEYAWEAWRKLRNGDDFNPDQYAEEPQDGRSHIRSQLLWDFFSLLNHDIAGIDEPSDNGRAFVKGKKYEEASPQELQELDMLASLLEQDPPVDELVALYRNSLTLRMESVEQDRYSFT